MIGVGILALVTLTSVGATMASRSMAVTAAATRFDALLDEARTTAHEIASGATLVFAPDAYGDGVMVRLYRGRPATGGMVAENTPPLETRAGITETQTLNAPGFALVIHADGRIRGVARYTLGATGTTELGCPASGAFHFAIAYAGGHADRYVPCQIPLATTSSVAFYQPPPATGTSLVPPIDSGCAGAAASCAAMTPAPGPNPTCPPGYLFLNASLCINPSLVYQLNVTPATIAIDVGQTARWTVTDTMLYGLSGGNTSVTSANSQSSACGDQSYSGSQWYPSGTTFSVVGVAAGTCYFQVVDSWGHAATVSVTVDQPFGPLQIATSANGPWGSAAAVTFPTAAAPSKTVFVQELYYTGAFTADASNCAGAAWMSAGPNGPGPSAFTVGASSQTYGCTIYVHDSHGGNAALSVVVNAVVCANGATPNSDGSCPGVALVYWYGTWGGGCTAKQIAAGASVSQEAGFGTLAQAVTSGSPVGTGSSLLSSTTDCSTGIQNVLPLYDASRNAPAVDVVTYCAASGGCQGPDPATGGYYPSDYLAMASSYTPYSPAPATGDTYSRMAVTPYVTGSGNNQIWQGWKAQ